jgi:predicted AAA+ superfamily ATPase
MDVTRAIEPDLTPGQPPVTILEGPRMSDKTHTARKLWANGVWDGYENLADPATFEIARHDLAAWLESLSPRVIIDEAQLLAHLPLRVKFLADQAGSRRRWLLTGSVSIGRAGLGGSDPLTGRAQRWTLSPLTAGELAGRPGGELLGGGREALVAGPKAVPGDARRAEQVNVGWAEAFAPQAFGGDELEVLGVGQHLAGRKLGERGHHLPARFQRSGR